MWWILLSLVWWYGTSAIPAPGSDVWKCPDIAEESIVECSCDMPHTLRCTGDRSAIQIIGRTLRSLDSASVSLLDCTVQNVSSLPGLLLEGVSLHGLVISSGEIKDVHNTAFQGLAAPLQALGLPNNQLTSVPTAALKSLPELDRLDLSSNKLKSLDVDSFKGLNNLSFVDLSNNVLAKIAPNTFSNLPQLKILRLRGNRLTIAAISKLEAFGTVEEIDFSGNSLIGPLDPYTFPKMLVKDLQLAHNSLSSIKMGALEGLTNLTSLTLHHNQIDVIEDHAFIHLSTLTNLDLSHNRIVAVSGASLAHLTNLVDLDLRHNFLRALTADLIVPLKSLQNLRLDDNDISIVSSDALKPGAILKRLTLSENPLNCDCSLTEFAQWLSNSSLSKDDKSSAVCTTPPSLENAVVVEVSIKEFLCGEDEQEALMAPLAAPVKAHINLQNFNYDGGTIHLQWYVEKKAIPYTCDAIFVYEEEGPNEVLLESNPLKCNSSNLANPNLLNVTVPNSSDLLLGHRYRYCVVLLETEQKTDEISLVLGCSDVIPLIPDEYKVPTRSDLIPTFPKVTAIETNITYDGHLTVIVNVHPPSACELNVAILEQNAVLTQKRINCTYPKHIFVGLNGESYRVCANIVKPGPLIDSGQKPRCITILKSAVPKVLSLDLGFIVVLCILSTTVFTLIFAIRKLFFKPKITTHQCFLPPEGEEQQHNRYVKLQATTKL